MNRDPYSRNYGSPEAPRRPIRTHLWYAIAALVVCFWPAGIVAVVYAVKTRNRLREGDQAAAARYSRLALIWSWVSLAIAIVIVIGLVVAEKGAGGGTSTSLLPVYLSWARTAA